MDDRDGASPASPASSTPWWCNGIKWDTGLQILLLLFAAVTLGGLGTAFGALVGSLVIGLVVELVAGLR